MPGYYMENVVDAFGALFLLGGGLKFRSLCAQLLEEPNRFGALGL